MGSAISAITEWVGSAVVGEFVTNMGFPYLRDRLLPANSEAKLNRLKEALPQIKAVMGIAEALKEKDPSTSELVEQFRQAVEASEDVLDELEYKRLEDKVKTRDEAGGSTSNSKKRKVSALNDDTLERLKKALTMLDQAASKTDHLLRLAMSLGIHDLSEQLRPETTSFLSEKQVFGREIEKEKIIGWLKRPTDARLSSFGVVGVGGLGKTTLAQFAYEFAYQGMHGSNHFDKIIWVCVSTNFNVEDITRKMLGELGESNYSGRPLNALQEALKEKIHLKKLLIILDDIWDDNKMSAWEQLVAPLRFVQQGSKIFFTTRMQSAADLVESVIGTEHESLALQGLGEKELRLLFQSYAFHGFNLYNHRDLQAIGDQILKMLRGSPLAAKVIGSLLNSRMDHQYLRRVLNQGSLFNLEQAKDMVEVLKLSYYHLPANLQVCFRFCSIFPQDHDFDKDELIRMWICSGFTHQQLCQDESLEDIGEDYFNHLLRKSFFEFHSNKRKTWYTMHDLIHELAQNVSYGECCRIESNYNCSTIPSTVRHAFVHGSAIDKVSHLENLRSLVIYGCDNLSSLNNLIKKPLRLLKVNVFCGTVELPEEISCLVHLRYLSIRLILESQPFQYSFLGSIYKLYLLQVLEFSTNSKNTSHPRIETTGITNLLSLRYMRLPNNTIETIYEIHKLTSLQELTFLIGKEIGYRINELSTLNNLRHLSIENIENIWDHTEAKSANLLGKNNLMSLSLKWTIDSNPIHPDEIIDHLQPPPSLMELTIENYNGHRCPKWMENSPPLNLSSLKLFNCPLWKNQLFSGNIPYLKILDIRDCQNLDNLPDMPLSLIEFRIYNVGLTSLPALYQNSDDNTSALRVVEIEKCPKLISLHGFLQQDKLIGFPAIEELTINGCERLVHLPTHWFGKLKSLYIVGCPNLTEFSTFLPLSLTEFRINCVGLSALPDYYQSPDSSSGLSTSSLKIVQIENCQNLRSLNGFLQQDNIDFQPIEKIEVKSCENLVHLPMGAFGKFVSLQNLRIWDCPMLMEVNKQSTLLPVALKYLSIRNCGKVDEPLVESASSLPILTSLWIINCANISRFPSSENAFRCLNELRISGCKKLIEHSSREQAHGADRGSSLASLKIKELDIDNHYLLLIEPLRSLSFVSRLYVSSCSGMEALLEQWFLQNSSSLKWLYLSDVRNSNTLPATMVRLTVLEELAICGADLLEELPELPASLRELYIDDASSLKSLPATMVRRTVLESLEISKADLLEELPELPACLRKLDIGGARSLKSLPATMMRLTALETIKITKADLLEKLPELPASLKNKSIRGRGGRLL